MSDPPGTSAALPLPSVLLLLACTHVILVFSLSRSVLSLLSVVYAIHFPSPRSSPSKYPRPTPLPHIRRLSLVSALDRRIHLSHLPSVCLAFPKPPRCVRVCLPSVRLSANLRSPAGVPSWLLTSGARTRPCCKSDALLLAKPIRSCGWLFVESTSRHTVEVSFSTIRKSASCHPSAIRRRFPSNPLPAVLRRLPNRRLPAIRRCLLSVRYLNPPLSNPPSAEPLSASVSHRPTPYPIALSLSAPTTILFLYDPTIELVL